MIYPVKVWYVTCPANCAPIWIEIGLIYVYYGRPDLNHMYVLFLWVCVSQQGIHQNPHVNK